MKTVDIMLLIREGNASGRMRGISSKSSTYCIWNVRVSLFSHRTKYMPAGLAKINVDVAIRK
jgi:hypothetical protein